MIIAAIIDGLNNAHADNASLFDSHSIDAYVEHWKKYDQNLTWKIENQDLCYFLAELSHPFGEKFTLDWDHEKARGTKRESGYFYRQRKKSNGGSYKMR